MKSPEQMVPYTQKEAEGEAFEMQERIKSGEAKDYLEAEKKIEFEKTKEKVLHPIYKEQGMNINGFIELGTIFARDPDHDDVSSYYEITKSPGSVIFKIPKGEEYKWGVYREALIREGYLPKIEGPVTREKWENIEKEKEQIIKKFDEVFNEIRVIDIVRNFRATEFFKEKFDGINNVIEVLKEAEEKGLIKIEFIPDYYTNDVALKNKVGFEFASKQELNEFLSSSAAQKTEPVKILRRAADLDRETVLNLLDSYKDKIDLSNYEDLFKPGSFIRNLNKEDKTKILDQVMASLEEKTEKAIKKNIEKDIWVTWDDVGVLSKCELMRDAAMQGVILSNFKERLQKLDSATDYYFGGYSEGVINNNRKMIENTALIIEKLSEIKNNDKITGKGLEILSSEIGSSKKIFLDGELIDTVIGAEFGENSTNGEVVAWVTHEVIDRNNITGTQNRDTVYAWKKGAGGPVQLFEDHAWSSERYFRVLAPEVVSDGTIKIEVKSGDKIEEKEFRI